MSKINNGEKLPDETQGEIKPFLLEGWEKSELDLIQKEALEINKLDLSDSGMARFLDSDYSIDTFINWLESKQLDIPYAIFKLVDEVKGWNENVNNTAKNQSDNTTKDKTDSKKRRDNQIDLICNFAKQFDYELLSIPEGGKAKIKNECLKNTLFTLSGFEHAWKEANKRNLISMKDKEKYL